MKVLSLKVSQFRGISAMEIAPDGKSVVVEGPNGSGKSSLLDSVMFALTGQAGGTAVHQGADQAEVEMRVGEYLVRRTCAADGKQRLVVRAADGSLKASPQKFLDGLVGAGLAFDPLKFEAMKPADQRQALLRGLGVDLSKLDQQRADAYATRTDVGRRQKEAAAAATGLDAPELQNLPASVDSAALLAEARRLREAVTDRERIARHSSNLRASVAELKARLAKEEQALIEAEQLLAATTDVAPACAAAEQALADAGKVGSLIERRKQLEHARDRAQQLGDEYGNLSDRIDAIDAEKEKLVASLQLGIAGLEILEDGLYVEGLPLASHNRAQRVRVGMRIAARLSPTLRVALVDEASSLDKASTADLAAAARELSLQLWMARVADDPSVHFEVWEETPAPTNGAAT